MSNPIIVYKGRTTVLQLALGIDVSNDVLTSEIRTEKDPTSELLATWVVTFATDGVDGEVILTLDDSETGSIERTTGFMDVKRIANGEPISALGDMLQVVFRGVVTA